MSADPYRDDYRSVTFLTCAFCYQAPTLLITEKGTGEEMQTCEEHKWTAFS